MRYFPADGYAQYGVANILGGLVEQPSEEVDLQVVDAVRNDLVGDMAAEFADRDPGKAIEEGEDA